MTWLNKEWLIAAAKEKSRCGETAGLEVVEVKHYRFSAVAGDEHRLGYLPAGTQGGS
jgi:hypothetical protein